MKLYATTTSERATKGQGGKYLKIEITSDKSILPVCFINIQEKDENNIHLSLTGNGSILKNSVYYVIPKEYNMQLKTKGKQQKGECNHHIIRDDYGKEYCQECGKYSFN
jgi:hypothetical protein